MSKRNGKIELLRFIFCMFVLLYHAGFDVIGGTRAISAHLSFFLRGRISVEFFFMVSGYLAAKSAYKQRSGMTSIGSDTFDFCAKKIKAILPYHIVAVLGSILLLAFYSDNFLHDFIARLPSAFLLQRTGVGDADFSEVEWYICSMLLALAIVYPLLRKSFDMTTLVLAPVVSSLLIGYMTKTYGRMPVSNQFGTFTYTCNIRGIALVLLGCFCYAFSEKVRARLPDFSRLQRALLVVIENVCWLISMLFVVSRAPKAHEAYIIYFMALGLSLTFSRDFTSSLYDHKWVYYLGRLSLPIYLCQDIAREIAAHSASQLRVRWQILFIVAIAILTGVAADAIYHTLKTHIAKRQ